MTIMKSTIYSTPPIAAARKGALYKSNISLSILCLIIVTLWNTNSVMPAPAKLDSLDSTFPLDLQPPIFEATVSASSPSQPKGDSGRTTIDSYGNPIENLKPIETPDGRKVVSAQGLQFEIPNYASGITELKKPSDDLLPPFVDKIGSGSSSSEEIKPKPKNPFLPTFDDGKYKPKATTRRVTTTTTTTTTTPAPEIIEKNPFEPTIPPWLKDFDYPDVGAAVPFIYDPNEDENPVNKNILPPAKTDDSDKTNLPPTSPFLNSQTPQGFTNKFTSSAIPLTSSSSSSIQSIVTVIPLPSTQTNQDDDSKLTRLPVVLIPPQSTSAEGNVIAEKSDEISKQTSSTFNKNFAAPFDPANSITTAAEGEQKKVPLSADRESFPPFNTLPSKTTFSKSEDGKVITNNVFLSGSSGSTSAAKPIGSGQAVNSPERNALTAQSATGSAFTKSPITSATLKQFATASTAASGFVTASSSTSDGSKYTGRFGGPPGVLAPQDTTSNGSLSKPLLTPSSATPKTATNNKDKFTGSFGGPPGVLKPFDNVKNR